MTPDVTVVVPVYNTLPYLRETLDSLVAQTLGHDRVEVVAVDDGSTDGSGELLDEYAARHPGLFTVIHQANSGGPAQPCNVGLDHARGRYVFFLGADDHLGVEALERMVVAADEWGSDVVCVRLVPTNGRDIALALFARNEAEIAFPDQRPFVTANTKLFRRSLLDEHGIRYDEELKIACDQPFTLEAMYRARRTSVLSDYDYYFAVLREDESNIMYQPDVLRRLDAIIRIMDDVAGFIPPGEVRDAVLVRHFRWEFGNRLRELDVLAPEVAAGVVERTARAARSYLTPGLDAMLPVPVRLRVRWARDGVPGAIEGLNRYDAGAAPLVTIGGDGLAILHLPPEVAHPDTDAASDPGAMVETGPFASARTLLDVHVDDVELTAERLSVLGTCNLDAAAEERFGGLLRPVGEQDALGIPAVTATLEPDADGSRFRLDFVLPASVRAAEVEDKWGLRFTLDLAQGVSSGVLRTERGFKTDHVPLDAGTDARTAGRALRVRTDRSGRLVLVCRRPGAPTEAADRRREGDREPPSPTPGLVPRRWRRR